MSSRRVAVFIDYWWVYTSARQAFGGAQPPAWFGNVAPAALAHTLVKRPPSSVRRSERVPAGLHIFIRGYDPDVHRGQHDRVERWLGEGATVDVGPVRTESGGAGFWQGSVSVALSCAVVEALTRGDCDTAVVFAGDAALLPLFGRMAGAQVPSARIELATWVAPDGVVPTSLASTLGVWCHRLGESSFKLVSDDRRGARGRGAAGRKGKADRQSTSMEAAFVAAGAPEGEDAGAQLVHPDLLPAPEAPKRLDPRVCGRGA